ncbi:MAG: zinc ABC transporter substrate-binding protein [Verrucomicrobiae bacterium]|nr:zinc ABC transporter substrate-binding protein [Verrucomicrobiae bacterium]
MSLTSKPAACPQHHYRASVSPPARAAVVFALVLALLAGCSQLADSPALKLGAATSYLECAARDVLGDRVEFIRLAEPGMCPGHFDLRPSQIADLRQCRALLRFDFQKSLDAKLTDIIAQGLKVVDVTVGGGMCEAASYLRACRQLADAFIAAGLIPRDRAEARCEKIAARVNGCLAKLQADVDRAGLKNLPVVASGHQKAFCETLGLRVVGSFRASDVARISEIDDVIQSARKAGVKYIIANLPEGRRLADALGERLGAKVVEFGNFPDAREGEAAFDKLIAANVRALLDAAR